MDNYKKWLIFSPLGLATIGFGASLLGHSIQLKIEEAKLLAWFLWGTCSLIVLNTGIAIFAEALKARVLYEMQKEGGRR
jgi:hypothetical protein